MMIDQSSGLMIPWLSMYYQVVTLTATATVEEEHFMPATTIPKTIIHENMKIPNVPS